MKNLLKLIVAACVFKIGLLAQISVPPQPATLAQVEAGTDNIDYITPLTLNQALSGGFGNQITFTGGSSLTDNGSGQLTLAAGGTNQNLVLTPSGSGSVIPSANNTMAFGSLTNVWENIYVSFVSSANLGALTLQTGNSGSKTALTISSSQVSTFTPATGGTATTTPGLIVSNTTASTSGATVQYSPSLQLIGHAWNTTATAADNFVQWRNELRPISGTSTTGSLYWSFSSSATSTPTYADVMNLTSTGALTISSSFACIAMNSSSANISGFSMNTFGISGGGSGVGTALSEYQGDKQVTSIADATATTVLTITVPNAAHSACIHLKLIGSLGAGGAVGANEASAEASYDVVVTRTSGVNAVAAISTVALATSAVVSGGSTITMTATLGSVAGGVSASNTIPIQVTISHGTGSSTNHKCIVHAEIINFNASGVTIG